MSALTTPMLVEALGAHRLKRNKKEAAADAVMHIGIQGSAAPWALFRVADQVFDRELTGALVAGAPGLRAVAANMSLRLDPDNGMPSRVRVRLVSEASREQARLLALATPPAERHGDVWRVAAAGFSGPEPRASAPLRQPQHVPALEGATARAQLESWSQRLPAVGTAGEQSPPLAATAGFSAVTSQPRGSETAPATVDAAVQPGSGAGSQRAQPDTGLGRAGYPQVNELNLGLGD
jgi:hypothetical protein